MKPIDWIVFIVGICIGAVGVGISIAVVAQIGG